MKRASILHAEFGFCPKDKDRIAFGAKSTFNPLLAVAVYYPIISPARSGQMSHLSLSSVIQF